MRGLSIPCTMLALLIVTLSACGEYPQTVNYKQGEYQGKPDARPYDNAAYNGDKAKWQSDIRARGQKQNEYTRVN